MLHRSETLRGYLLMSPTLLIMALGIAVPFVILIVMSTWTRQGFEFDTTPTIANYERCCNGRSTCPASRLWRR
jgi:spermidine/putrescine transport system permease protein